MTVGAALVPNNSSKDLDAEIPPMKPKVKIALVAIFIKGFIDLVANYALTPALIFYVRELGGTNFQYGLITGANSLSSLFFMPFYANWVDKSGNKFRSPYFTGVFVAILGNLLYTLAVTFDHVVAGLAIYVLLASRLLHGIGDASHTLNATYIASVVKSEQLTPFIIVMGIINMAGLGLAPYLNTFLRTLDTTITVLGLEIPLKSHNGIGLLVASIELLEWILLYFLVSEPPPKQQRPSETKVIETRPEDVGWKVVAKEITSDLKLLMPLFTQFMAYAAFSLMEAGIPPSSAHALGWGTVELSEVMTWSTAVMGVSMGVTIVLSKTYHVPDTTLVVIGCSFLALAGLGMYSFWTFPGTVWLFVAPLVIGFIGVPLMAPANQSNYYKATMARPELSPIHARLQSIYGLMGASATFSTPIFLGAYVLRSPAEVEGGTDKHELTLWAMYVPIVMGLSIAGFLYENAMSPHTDNESEETGILSESSPLLKSSDPEAPKVIHKKVVMLISSLSTNHQTKSNQNRALTILKGLGLEEDRVETIDGATDREKRNELFGVSGIRAHYPQFFLATASDEIVFFADYSEFESMNEMGTLKESMNLEG